MRSRNRKKRTLKDVELREISLVSRPAVESARIVLMKRQPPEDGGEPVSYGRLFTSRPAKADVGDLILVSDADRATLDAGKIARIERHNHFVREAIQKPSVGERLDELTRDTETDEDDSKNSSLLLMEAESIADSERLDDESLVDAFRRLERTRENDRFSQLLATLRRRAAA